MAGTVAVVQHNDGYTMSFVGVTFTAALTTAISSQQDVAATQRMRIRAFRLTTTGNSARATIQLRGSTTGVYFADAAPIVATGEASHISEYSGSAYFCSLVAGEELVIGDGGAGGLLDGYVLYDIITV